MKKALNEATLVAGLKLIRENCPRLVASCYWAGTSAIALEELHHRRSFDLDFHTRLAHQSTAPLLEEIRAAFPGAFRLLQTPDAFGSGFQGILMLEDGVEVAIEVLSNFEQAEPEDMRQAKTVQGVMRVSLERYLADKIQCVAERMEARDLVDIQAVLSHMPVLQDLARRILREQDALILAERLLSWTDKALADDLVAYPDVNPVDARKARDWLSRELKTSTGEDV